MAMDAARKAEWRAHWPLVMAAFVGYSLPSVAIYSTGLFIEPLSREFGWSRTQITAGLSLQALLIVPLSPFAGALIDRFGVRRLAVPGIVLTGLSIAAFGLASGALWQWFALWMFFGLAHLLVKSTLWTTAVSSTFNSARSLALGVTLSGAAFAAGLTPPLGRWLADTYGWREAYMILGIGWAAPTLLLSLLFLFDVRDRTRLGRPAASDTAVADLPGLSVKEAARSLPLIRIGLSTLVMLMLASALVVHKFPLLTEAGVGREHAALLTGLSGVAGIAGKLVTGWLMQRWDAGWVGGATNVLTGVALIALLEPFRTPALIVGSMLLVGYASGASLQICAYLTSVYAGLRNFGKIFGVMAAIIAVSSGVGPTVAALMHDLTGDYTLLILTAMPACLLGGLLLVRLGAAPKWSAAPAAA